MSRRATMTADAVKSALEREAADDFVSLIEVTFPDTDTLIEYLKANEILHAFILIKGSRGNKLERITEYL